MVNCEEKHLPQRHRVHGDRTETKQQKHMIRTVTAVVDDMFFISKIRETGKALGLIVNFPRNLDGLRASLAGRRAASSQAPGA